MRRLNSVYQFSQFLQFPGGDEGQVNAECFVVRGAVHVPPCTVARRLCDAIHFISCERQAVGVFPDIEEYEDDVVELQEAAEQLVANVRCLMCLVACMCPAPMVTPGRFVV